MVTKHILALPQCRHTLLTSLELLCFSSTPPKCPQILPNGDRADGDEDGAGADQDILLNPDADDEGNNGI